MNEESDYACTGRDQVQALAMFLKKKTFTVYIFLYLHSFRSATSLDELEIELEGDLYPLNELASISKKDPKRLIIDASAFPQATKNILMAIKNSGTISS